MILSAKLGTAVPALLASCFLLLLLCDSSRAQGLVCRTFDLPNHAGFAGDFCASRLPSTAKICSPEKESFALQLKAISDKLVNQATSFWCGHQASVVCKALGSPAKGSCSPELFCGSFVASNCEEDRDCLELSTSTQCCPYCALLTDAAGCPGGTTSIPAFCSQNGCAPTKPCSASARVLPLLGLTLVLMSLAMAPLA